MSRTAEVLSFVNARFVTARPSIYDIASQLPCGYNHCAVLSFVTATLCSDELIIPTGSCPLDIEHIEIFRGWYMSDDSRKHVHVFPIYFDGCGHALYFDLTYGQFDSSFDRTLRSLIISHSSREDIWNALSVFRIHPIDMTKLSVVNQEDEVEEDFAQAYAQANPNRTDVSRNISLILANYQSPSA